MPAVFDQLTKIQKELSDLSLTAHVAGYHDMSTELSNFRHRIETVNNDMQEYFHDNEQVLTNLLEG